MFEIRKLAGKGNGIVATESIKAGTVVHREQPLMRLGSEFIDQYHGSTQKGTEGMLAAVSYFRNQMSVEDQRKYLSFHGADASGPFADNLRGFIDKIQIDGKPLTKAEKAKYIGVALVLAFNAFGDSKDVRIYETASRFCRSCESNCTYALDGPEITVRALTCVQAGEELTLDYYASRRLQPTHVRRFKWLEVKDFTCCCPRCDTPGDDTRQFHCHDSECPGRHFVCQPLNKNPHLLPGMAYTGVEYVEPHLLSCTVCRRSPPAAYQTAMFQLEKKWNEALQLLPTILEVPTTFTFFLPDKHGRVSSTTLLTGYPHRSEIPARMQKLGSLHYQVTHVTGFFLAVHELRARFVLSKEGESGHKPRMLQLVTEMEPMLSCFYPLPYVVFWVRSVTKCDRHVLRVHSPGRHHQRGTSLQAPHSGRTYQDRSGQVHGGNSFQDSCGLHRGLPQRECFQCHNGGGLLRLLRGVPRARRHDPEPLRRLQEGGLLRRCLPEGALAHAQGTVRSLTRFGLNI
jgi:hypothetical protein